MKKDFYNDTYIGNKLNLISQIGNALSGGRADISISARCGYFGSVKKDERYTKMQKFIDWTFEPIEEEGHCLRAYLKDPNEDYGWNKLGEVGIFIIKAIVYVFCPILALLFYGHKGIKQSFNFLKKYLFLRK
jgi:hypothetical protein